MILPREDKKNNLVKEYKDTLYNKAFSLARISGTDEAAQLLDDEVLRAREGMNRTIVSAQTLAAALEVRALLAKTEGSREEEFADLFEARGLMGSPENADRDIGRLDAMLGDSCEALGNIDGAISFYTLAAQRYEKNRPPAFGEAAMMKNNLAMLCRGKGQHDDAINHFMEAIAFCRESLESDQLLYADLCFNLACQYEDIGSFQTALKWHTEAYNSRTMVLDAMNQEIGLSAAAIAICHAQLGNNDEAYDYFERAEPILRRNIRLGGEVYSTMVSNYVIFLRNIGKHAEAEAMDQLGKSLEIE